jgi:hypothetical protein
MRTLIYLLAIIVVIALIVIFTPEASDDDIIEIYSPKDGDEIASPLTVTGKARGYWFFEGDFPVILTDWDGKIIAESFATAQGEWMTEDFVDFEGVIEFEKPEDVGEFSNRGSLIFQKDNPSDLPELDDAREMTVFFK